MLQPWHNINNLLSTTINMRVMQVHVMVRSEGHDPSLTRTLKEAAHSLSGLNAVHSPSLGPLLPETTKMECGTVFVDLQAVRVSAGSLASMNRGESVSSLMTMQDNNTAHTKDRKTQST